jgi:hypothetical protein
MRSIRVILSFVLALLSGNAAAEWTAVRGADEIHTPFADRSTIRRSGAIARMSGMYDFRKQDYTPDGKGLYSTVVLREYDCAARRVRLLSYIDFSDHMGTGTVVGTGNAPGRWENLVPGALDEAYWTIACGEPPR